MRFLNAVGDVAIVPSLRWTRGPGPCAADMHWTKFTFHQGLTLVHFLA